MGTCEVLLVRPPINRRTNAPFFLPLGLLCVAAPLREAGFPTEIIDFEYLYRAGRMTLPHGDIGWLDVVCEPVLARQPAIVGLTVLADTLPVGLLIGRYIKQRNASVTVVIGGPGVFGTYPALLERFGDAIDYLCVNEGEQCLTELARRLAAGEARPKVPGFHAVVNGEIVDCGRLELADINLLPMPAYDLVPVPEYLRLASPRIFDVYLGSGCTYACKFCVTAEFWERDFRSKAPEVILHELDHLYNLYGITRVNFLHDNFANRRRYLDDFIDYFLTHNTRYEWGCAVRPDNVTRDQLARMKRAGCFNVFCGIDAGSSRLLRQMSKMPDASRSYRFFRDSQGVGLAFETNTILGFPNESDADLEDSLRLIFSAVAHGGVNSDVSVLQPLPGAAVTREHAQDLQFVEDQGLGTFLPDEALVLAKSNPDLFSGFYFIRHENRPFEWYGALCNKVRFFTRHWFRTLYFLVNCAGYRYLDLLSQMEGVTDPARFGDCFQKLWATLELPGELQDLANAVFCYDRAEELLKGCDVSSEVENIYASAPMLEGGTRYLLGELAFPVHRLFAQLPDLDVSEIHPQATWYLRIRNGAGEITTLSLRPWQVALWQQLEERPASPEDLEELVNALGTQYEGGTMRVRSAVEEAYRLFSNILDVGRPVATTQSIPL